jgi:hypothetical protein
VFLQAAVISATYLERETGIEPATSSLGRLKMKRLNRLKNFDLSGQSNEAKSGKRGPFRGVLGLFFATYLQPMMLV